MSDAAAQVNDISRAIANLDSKLTTVLPKLNNLINPAATQYGGSQMAGSLATVTSAMGSNPVTGALAMGINVATGMAQMAMGALPDVGAVTSYNGNYYQSALVSGGQNKYGIARATFGALKGGITSPGSDAMVSAAAASKGIMASANPNSTYMQMMTNVKNSAMVLGMDNATSFEAISSLTSGKGAGSLMSSLGIYASDASGKSKSENQIFNEIYASLNSGQGKATAQEVMDSFYKGNLGASLTNIGFSDAQKQRFLSFAVARAGGSNLNLGSNSSSNSYLKKLGGQGNTNPYQASMDIYSTQTGQMQSAMEGYEKGMSAGAADYQALDSKVKDLVTNFGALNAELQTILGTNGPAAALSDNPLTSGMMGSLNDLLNMLKGDGAVNGVKNQVGGGGFSDSGNAGSMRAAIPANGPVTATIGQKGKMWGAAGHNGTDYGVPNGSPVYAAADGVVATDTVGAGSRSYGHYVTLDHGNGYKTLYAHLDASSADVHPGDVVKAGQVIGKSGSTGHVTGPHLHFEVRKDGVSVDPSAFLSGAVKVGSPKSSKGAGGNTGYLAATDTIFDIGANGFTSVLSTVASSLGISSPQSGTRVSSWSGTGGSSVSAPSGTGVGGPSSGVGLGMSSGAATVVTGGGYGNKVDIHVNIAQASEKEAKRFAHYVKQILDSDKITSNMGAY